MKTFPKDRALDHLRRYDVGWVVVKRANVPPALLGLVPRLDRVYADDRAEVDVYAIRSQAPR